MRYAIIGAGGYIAPRHMKAIVDTGGKIVAACDVHDAVGVLDHYAPDCRFTCVPEEFFRDFLRDVDAVAVCTPNYLHVTHAQQALAAGCDVVLEKPIAPRATGHGGAETLIERAKDYANVVYPIVQLRYHPEIQELRGEVKQKRTLRKLIECEIDYATYRGPWYDRSWKGRQVSLSGGLLANLGVHLFDLCLYVFGPLVAVDKATIEYPVAAGASSREARGEFRCMKAHVKWRLSSREREPRRVFKVMGRDIDLSNQMRSLHKHVYEEVALGRGFSLDEAAQALRLIEKVEACATRS